MMSTLGFGIWISVDMWQDDIIMIKFISHRHCRAFILKVHALDLHLRLLDLHFQAMKLQPHSDRRTAIAVQFSGLPGPWRAQYHLTKFEQKLHPDPTIHPMYGVPLQEKNTVSNINPIKELNSSNLLWIKSSEFKSFESSVRTLKEF